MADSREVSVGAPQIILVNDQESATGAMKAAVASLDCELLVFDATARALEHLTRYRAAAIVVNLSLAGTDGVSFAEQVREYDMSTPLVFLTKSDHTPIEDSRAYHLGAVDFMTLSMHTDVLAAKLRFIVELFKKNRQLELRSLDLEKSAEAEKTFILEHALDGVIAADENSRIMFWNAHAERMFGWSKAEVIGRDLTLIIVPERFRDAHRAGIRRFIDTGVARIQNRRIEIPALRKAGDEFPMELTVSSVKTKDGFRFYSFVRDVTEQRLAREALQDAKLKFEKNVDVSPAILWITEVDGSCTYLSQQWYEFTGQSETEALGFGWLDMTHPDDRAETERIYRDANARQVPFRAEYRLRTRSGVYRWAIDAGNPRYDASGTYSGFAGTVIDIHDQKLSADAIKDIQYRFERSAQATKLGVWYCDLPFDVLIWNDEVKHHFFLPPDARVTMDVFFERIHPDDREATRLAIEHSIKSHTAYNTIYRTVNPRNPSEMKSIRAIGWTDYNAGGDAIRFDGITLDVTDELRRNQELETAKQAAEHANELKSAFLANMSHEIRTPLGAMLGFADLLRDHGLTKTEHTNYIDILARNGEQLAVIINDILDLSKVEAGHLTLEFTETYPDRIASEVISLLRVKAKEKDLALEYKSDESTPPMVIADPTRVRQVLLNLVANAIKFTRFGSVTLRSYGCKSSNGRASVCFEVTDTGIGLSGGQLEKIFDVFVQADGSMTRRFGGTGLGLALSRRLARALGGDVSVLRSERDRGSTFLFQFEDQPDKREQDSTVSAEESQQVIEYGPDTLRDVRVLVVDDAPDNQQLIWRYLTKHGASVDSAENGLLGYRKALTGEHDLILMDIQMPEMDGYTATQKLRAAGYTKPIIALTAHAMTEVRKKCLNVGCTEHLSKPINQKQLIGAIAKLTHPHH